MWAAGVVDLGLPSEAVWNLTPAEFTRLFSVHLEREDRANRRAALIATYIANYAGRMRKDGEFLTVDDLLGKRPEAISDLERFRRAVDYGTDDFLERIRASDPTAHVTMSRAVLDAISGGAGTWSKLGADERPLEPVAILKAMHPERRR